MARILFVNTVCSGSTGTICKNLYNCAEKKGHKCCIAYGRGNNPENFTTIQIGNKWDVYNHVAMARVFDQSGMGSKKATYEFLKKVDDYQPDIIHLHNIHGYYLNIEIFFNYLKRHPEIKKIWTLHDCWSYTGHCSHYLFSKCKKWENGCSNCQYIFTYPKAYVDNSEKNYKLKKKIFTNVENMTIVCVSQWLKQEVEHSFLKDYLIKVITNGIDMQIFSYKESKFKTKYKICDKKVVLGVANIWDDKKGLGDFFELRKKLSDEYVVVLVGLSLKQIKNLPTGIVGIQKTENQRELVEIYSAADVFFNPTKEETFGLTNVEAQACGTAVVSYNSGGTKETLVNDNTYFVKNVDEFLGLLLTLNFNKCQNNKALKFFDKNIRMQSYLELYDESGK